MAWSTVEVRIKRKAKSDMAGYGLLGDGYVADFKSVSVCFKTVCAVL